MANLLQSPMVAAGLGAVLYLGTTWYFWRTPEPPVVETVAETPHSAPPVSVPSWDYFNPEIDQLVEELKKERASLADRQKQLEELAARVQSERAELSALTQTVSQLQIDFDKTLIRVNEEEKANLKKLSRVYSSMTPDGAVNVLKQLDDVQIVKILAFLKEEEVAPILENLARGGEAEAKRVALLAERLRLALYRKPTDSAKP